MGTARAVLALLQALAPLFALLAIAWKAKRDQATGTQIEAGKVDAVSAGKQAAIAQAVADAPDNQVAVIDRLNAGTF